MAKGGYDTKYDTKTGQPSRSPGVEKFGDGQSGAVRAGRTDSYFDRMESWRSCWKGRPIGERFNVPQNVIAFANILQGSPALNV